MLVLNHQGHASSELVKRINSIIKKSLVDSWLRTGQLN